ARHPCVTVFPTRRSSDLFRFHVGAFARRLGVWTSHCATSDQDRIVSSRVLRHHRIAHWMWCLHRPEVIPGWTTSPPQRRPNRLSHLLVPLGPGADCLNSPLVYFHGRVVPFHDGIYQGALRRKSRKLQPVVFGHCPR